MTAYDLSYRRCAGSTARYRVAAAYHDLDQRGLRSGSEIYIGEMDRRVLDSGPPVREEIVWSSFLHRTLDKDGRVAAEVPLEWAEGFSYENRFDSVEGFVEASAGIQRDVEGWNVFLLMLDAHIEFDLPRSEAGKIGSLRVPGDEVELTSDGPTVLDFEPFIRAEFEGGLPSRSRFLGITGAGHASAVLESNYGDRRYPFTMTPGGGDALAASTSLRREVQVRLPDGLLERGTSVEWVCVEGRWINPIYTIELLDERRP